MGHRVQSENHPIVHSPSRVRNLGARIRSCVRACQAAIIRNNYRVDGRLAALYRGDL